MTAPDFVHLHVHSEYSLLDGAARLKDLVGNAAAQGMTSLALTDHGVMYGVVDFYKLCKQHGIHPILGCEVYVATRGRLDKTPHVDSSQHHLLLLAENETGYKNLLKLVSAAHLEGFYYKPRVDRELLAEHSQGLIAMSACLAGEIPAALMAGNRKKAAEAAGVYREIFGQNNFFLEMMDHGLKEQQSVNSGLRELSRSLSIPLVATNDLHYVRKEDASVQDVLLCIQTGKTIKEEHRMRFESQEFYLKSAAEMAAVFPDDPEALRQTLEIAERCQVDFDFNHLYLPEYQVPEGESLDSYLVKLCEEGINRRFPEVIPAAARERLDYELSVLRQMGFAGYFLIVQDFITWARQHGIPVGPGRGSAAGSLVSYVLGITDLNPLKYGLIFERFLNPERISMPDIDIDICYERRSEVIDYVVGKYGADHVSQIITFGTMLARGAIRDVGRVLNVPLAEVDRIAKLVPEELGITLDRALETSPELKQLYDEDEQVRQLVGLAQAIEGMPRHASTHAAGVVITREPLTHYLPLQRTGDVITTQFPMETVEGIGLLKMDFLGLRTLTVISDTLKIIEEREKIRLDLDRLPLDDPATYTMLSAGETVGVFQLESSGMRHILRNMKPQRFEDLVPLVALYRPGPLKSGMVDDFISRMNGQTRVEYPHPVLESILSETYGVILYQEQVMQISSDLAGFSMAKADTLRKAMGKKKPEVIAKMRESFVQGAAGRQVDPKTAGSIFDLMENFAGYGFNKSHSAAYALIAYQTAYFKANYPVALLAALLTSVRGNSDKVSYYIQECRRMNIEIMPPDINESLTDFTVVGDKRIRFGLGAVKNVGEGAVTAIIQARKTGSAFCSLDDFCERVDLRQVNKRVVESLILCGAFSSLQGRRSQLVAVLDDCMETVQANRRSQGAQADGQVSLFDLLDEPGTDHARRSLPDVPEYPSRELLTYEKEMLGFYISGHPLEGFRDILAGRITYSIGELSRCKDGDRVTLGGIVSGLKRGTTRRGDGKITFALEDMGGSVEVVFIQKIANPVAERKRSNSNFPQSNGKNSHPPEDDAVVLVTGRLSQQEETYRIFADAIAPLEINKPVKTDHVLYIRINPQAGNPEVVERLQLLFIQHRGQTPVLLYFVRQKKLIKTDASFWADATPDLCYQIEGLCGPGSCFLLDRESELLSQKAAVGHSL
jgi:DNA polymerase-3 subunit alpha